MTDKSKAKYEYWSNLCNAGLASLNEVSKEDYLNISEDDLPEDIVLGDETDYVKCNHNISSEKIDLIYKIKMESHLNKIEAHLKTIKIYIAIAFWISIVAGIIAGCSLII